jgi:uncharacterized membrane protein
LVQILAGVSLAACAGLRAFLPLFVVGAATRLGLTQVVLGETFQLNETFAWLGSTPALVILGVAVVAEVLADKIPAVDNALDLVQTLVRPLAGALVMAASLDTFDPVWASVVGLVVGGGVAGGVHAAKAKLRLMSTFGTGGLASPFLSTAEDVAAGAGSLLAVVFTFAAAILIALGLVATAFAFLRFRRRAQRFESSPG